MTKRMIIMLVAVGLLFGGIFGFQIFKGSMIKKYLSSQGQPPQTVSTTKAEYSEWQPGFQAVGTLRAVRGADIAVEVPGVVTTIHFQSGQEVQAGTPLVQLNAEADVARLQSLAANVEIAQINHNRNLQQLKIQAVSESVVDASAANLKTAKAQLAEQQALVNKKLVRAPFSGRLGIRAVDMGQFLNAGTKLVTLQALDPIFIDFTVPQRSLNLVPLKTKISVTADAAPGQKFQGDVSSIDAKVDTATRNVQVRATLRNTKQVLLPGMFATVSVASGAPQRYITLPQTAVTFNPYGDTVFVIVEKTADEKSADGKAAPAKGAPAKAGTEKAGDAKTANGGGTTLIAQQRFVTTGDRRGDQVAIVSGLKEGEVVVTAGQMKLRSGTPVVINNSIQPSNDPAPQPKDE